MGRSAPFDTNGFAWKSTRCLHPIQLFSFFSFLFLGIGNRKSSEAIAFSQHPSNAMISRYTQLSEFFVVGLAQVSYHELPFAFFLWTFPINIVRHIED